MWVDAHLHLDDSAFDLDRDAVIARALEAGVRWMVLSLIHISEPTRPY